MSKLNKEQLSRDLGDAFEKHGVTQWVTVIIHSEETELGLIIGPATSPGMRGIVQKVFNIAQEVAIYKGEFIITPKQ